MELKYTNLNGEIVLAKDLNLAKVLFLKNCENWIRNESYKKFQEDALIAQKTRLPITFTIQIQME